MPTENFNVSIKAPGAVRVVRDIRAIGKEAGKSNAFVQNLRKSLGGIQPLFRQFTAAGKTVGIFNSQIQRASKSVGGLSAHIVGIRALQREIAKLNLSLVATLKAIPAIRSAQILSRPQVNAPLRMAANIDRLTNSLGLARKLLALFRSTLVIVATAFVIRGLATLLDTFVRMQNRLKLVTRNMSELGAVQKELFAISQRTGTELEANNELFTRIARSVGRLNLTYRQILRITETVAKSLILSGAAASESVGGLRQFSQGLAAGAAQGEELRSIVENLPFLADIIGKEFKIAGGELIAFNKQDPGIIASQRIVKAVLAATDTVDKAFEKTTDTLERGLTRLGNAFNVFIGLANQTTGVGKGLISVFDLMARHIGFVVSLFVGLFATILGFAVVNALFSSIIKLNKGLGFLVNALFKLKFAFLGLITPVRLLITSFGNLLIVTNRLTVALSVGLARSVLALFRPLRTLRLILTGIVASVKFLVAVLLLAKIGILGIAAALIGSVFLLVKFKDSFNSLSSVVSEGRKILDRFIVVVLTLWDTISINPQLIAGALKEAFIVSLNAVINVYNKFAIFVLNSTNLVIRGINKLIDVLNSLSFDIVKIPKISLFEVDNDLIPKIENDAKGSINALFDTIKSTYERRLKEISDPTGYATTKLKESFARITNLLKQFFGLSLPGGEGLDNTPPVQGSGGIIDERLKRLIESVSPYEKAVNKLSKATTILVTATSKGTQLPEGLGIDEILKRVQREIVGVGNATSEYEDKLNLLEDAFVNNIISSDEFLASTSKLKLAFLSTRTDLVSGFQRGFERIKLSVRDFASAAENVVVNAFDGMSNAFTQFLETGEINFAKFIRSLSAQILKLAIQMAILRPLLGFLSPSIAGGTSVSPIDAGAAGALEFGSANGGLFRGRGGPRSDSNPALISDGEYIVNAMATRRYLPLLEAINNKGQRFQNGGFVGSAQGARSSVGGNSVVFSPEINVSVQRGNNSSQEDDVETARIIGNKINEEVQTVFYDLVQKEQRPGGLLSAA